MTVENLIARINELVTLAQLCADPTCDEIDYEDFSSKLVDKRNTLFSDLDRYFAVDRNTFVQISVRVGDVFAVEQFSKADAEGFRDLPGMLSLISTKVTRDVVEHYEKIRKETQISEGHRQSLTADGT